MVLLRGDGILIIFEIEKSKNKNEAQPDQSKDSCDSEKIHIGTSAFWNLIDPTEEGKVVIHTEKNWKL